MEIYYGLKVKSTDEVLMALLTQYEFESFQEEEDHFIAYISKPNFDETVKSEVIEIILKFTTDYEIEEIQPQNWNELWEASFQPVVVRDFCQIRADFHPAISDIQYDLVINPKMAFGTGHHATTHMMIDQMSGIDFSCKDVFDFGCGTGILAILASKIGAKNIDALDIEHESFLNTIENSQITNVKNVVAFEGDLDQAPNKKYDIILANINRNILVKYAEQLSEKLADRGVLLFSGVLIDDKEIVVSTYETLGFKLEKILDMDGWVCGKMVLNHQM
jgi:ribosomal protein L11 methyltransferase